MERQGQETDHLDPVVALVQMGAFMLQDVLPGLPVHAHGDVDPGLDESQNKGSFDLVALPAAPDADSFPYFIF